MSEQTFQNDDKPPGLLRTDQTLMVMATEMAHVAVWEYDFVRDSMERSANHDALYGLPWQSHWHSSIFLNATHEEDREKCYAAIELCLVPHGPNHYAFDFRVIWPDQSIHWLWVRGEVVRRDLTGRGTLIRGIIFDVTERKENENRIQRISKLYSALSEVNQAIVRMETEESLFPLVCRLAVDFGGMTLASIGMVNEESGLIESVASYGNGSDYLRNILISVNEAFPEGRGPVGTALRESRIVVINHFIQNEMTKPWHHQAKQFGWKSVGAFPIMRGGKPFSVLSVYHTEENAYDKEAISLLDEMTRDISFALDGFDKALEKQEISNALVANERHFRAYFERAMVGMATASPDRVLLEVNDSMCKLLGYSKEELTGMNSGEITHPDDLQESARLTNQLLNGDIDEFEVEKRYIKKNGGVIYAHLAARAVRKDNGEIDYFVSVVNDITKIKSQQNQLERLVHHDPLTGLPNRLLLNDRLEMAVSNANRSGSNMAVCFLDLDTFKAINDTHGHPIGDKVLVEVANRLTSISRSIDTIARIGGDEFILVLTEISDEHECRKMLERVNCAIETMLELDGIKLQISASIGVAIYPDKVTDGSALLRHADQAMYVAKQSGRRRIHFFDAITDHQSQIRSEGLSRIELALAHDELTLHYQPIVNMRSRKIVGLEALIRWQHPDRGILSPGEFLPYIENSEFEIKLSEWVITQGVIQLESWVKQGFNIYISFNLPARHLQSDGFVDFIAQLAANHPSLMKSLVRLEILETAAIGDLTSAIRKMEMCIGLGILFSIDDFGTGYASLSYFRRLPADTIKIDQSFVQGMLNDVNDLSIVKGVIGLAEAFQKNVIAEGVETVEHSVKLLTMGCDIGQGYGIARPMNAENVLNWIRESNF